MSKEKFSLKAQLDILLHKWSPLLMKNGAQL